MDYVDFEIEIDIGHGRKYPVRVVRSPAGETRETMSFPFDKLALESRLKDLQISLLSSGTLAHRRHPTQYEETVQRFGTEMFTALFVGEVRSRYDVCQELAYRQDKGIRIRLCIRPPELAVLPWEFLYDTRIGDYVCLSRDTSIVRYLELPHPVQPLSVTPPLQILVMIVSPTDLVALDVDIEKQRIERSLEPLQQAGLVKITWLNGQTWRDLRNSLLKGTWHIFHFVGHGGFDLQHEEGLIVLAKPDGRSHFFTATEFSRLLADHRSLRLVVLNACDGARNGPSDVFSSTATTLIQRGIPAVVAMQYAISDIAAIEFAHTFYKTLISGVPVDVALSEARKAISFEIKNSLEWGTPVLYMRPVDGSIFVVEPYTSRAEVIHARDVTSSLPVDEQTGKAYKHDGSERSPFQNLRANYHATIAILLLLSIVIVSINYSRIFNLFAPTPSNAQPLLLTPSSSSPNVTPTAIISNTTIVSVETKVNRRDNAIYVLIPAGKFVMGADDGELDERPEHIVDLPEFWIKQTEVTNQEYTRCWAAGVCTEPNNNWRYEIEAYPQYPVTSISWEQAYIYAEWLSGRLPTEAEWEKACRGDKRRKYPWGDDLPIDKFGQPPNLGRGEVGRFPLYASPYGVLDLVGNVEEWTNSIWGDDLVKPKFGYPYVASADREQIDELLSMRVIRGGFLLSSDNIGSARCAKRYRDYRFSSNSFYGFRVVLDPTPKR